MSWTDRLEAVKSYVFDSEGNVVARGDESKRAPGCYTLKDAIKLTHSAVCQVSSPMFFFTMSLMMLKQPF